MSIQAYNVCRALGIKVSANSDPGIVLARKLREGLNVNVVSKVAKQVAPNDKSFAYKVIPRASLIRFKKAGKLSAIASDKIYNLSRVWEAAEYLYKDPEKAREFLKRPHPLLGGEIPLELVHTSSAGADVILDLINRATAGVASQS